MGKHITMSPYDLKGMDATLLMSVLTTQSHRC